MSIREAELRDALRWREGTVYSLRAVIVNPNVKPANTDRLMRVQNIHLLCGA
jgi:hypothetical protein